MQKKSGSLRVAQLSSSLREVKRVSRSTRENHHDGNDGDENPENRVTSNHARELLHRSHERLPWNDDVGSAEYRGRSVRTARLRDKSSRCELYRYRGVVSGAVEQLVVGGWEHGENHLVNGSNGIKS